MTVQGSDMRMDAPLSLRDVLQKIVQELEAGQTLDRSVFAGSVFDGLAALFGLNDAESAALALLAGAALDRRCAAALSHSGGSLSVGDLMASLPRLDWESLSSGSVLRSWFLIRVDRALNLQDSAVGIDPRILDWCLGLATPDARLGPYLRPLAQAGILSDPHTKVADGCAERLADRVSRGGAGHCVVVGEGPATRDAVAARIAQALTMEPVGVDPAFFELPVVERSALERILARETVLARVMPVFSLEVFSAREASRLRTLEMPTLILAGEMAHRVALPPGAEAVTLEPPDAIGRAALWQYHLGEGNKANTADLAETFTIGADEIAQIAADLQHLSPNERAAAAKQAARRHLAPPPDPLVQEIKPHVSWEDLVLPGATEATLRLITAQIRHRAHVYREWHFGERLSRGLGITALFSGPSGTGKTLAAEVMAAELGLPLLRVNLAQVVDKYIGETEKHLDHVFRMAERAGAILFFDEAEALFHKRGDGDNAQERFSAMTVAYLLQRLETCAATCLLATNMRASVDDAFLRRMRFAVHFAFPAAAERTRLWAAAFPAQAPLENIDTATLAILPATGGTIRNAALNAAFLAADAGGAIGMDEVLAALEIENAKLPQPIDLAPLRRRVLP